MFIILNQWPHPTDLLSISIWSKYVFSWYVRKFFIEFKYTVTEVFAIDVV